MSIERRVESGPVTQFAVLDALLAGAYASGISVGDVLEVGDFGIGCVEHLGGEVVILDGDVYECTVDGPPTRMVSDEVLPFVNACRFHAGAPRRISRCDLTAFTECVEDGLVSRNLFHAVRVDGRFSSVRVRATPRQEFPLRPLADVASGQIETVISDARGTLAGFWAPAIYQGITVAGLHLHFIADDRTVGGHVLDVTIGDAQLTVCAYSRFELRLPTDELFLTSVLSHDDDHRIVAVEGGATRQAPARTA